MGYKAFSKGMICQGKQYAENAVFEESGADSCCKKGVMHYCETPFDCLDYYPIVDSNADFTEFAEVEPLDKVLVQDNKRATKKLKIGAKLSFKDFIKAGISVLIESTKDIPNGENSSGYGAQIGSSGDRAQIGSSGNWAKIGSSGNWAQIGSSGEEAQIGSSGDVAKIGSSGNLAQIGSSGNFAQIGSSGNFAQIGSSGNFAQIGSSGYGAQIGSSGNFAQIGSSGYKAKIGSSGDEAQIGSSGYKAQIGSSGNWAQIGSSGDEAQIGSSGNYAVVSAIGYKSAIKAKIGSWIVLAEYDKELKPVCVRAAQIDGEKLKPDTFYTLENGEFTEIEMED